MRREEEGRKGRGGKEEEGKGRGGEEEGKKRWGKGGGGLTCLPISWGTLRIMSVLETQTPGGAPRHS